MLIRRAPRFKSSEITDEKLYLRRREFISGAAAAALAPLALGADRAEAKTPTGAPLKATKNAKFVNPDPPTDFQAATTYNNFYEFGTDKEDPSRNSGKLQAAAVGGPDRRARGQAAEARRRPDPDPGPARGARLLAPLRRGVVDGDPVDRLPALGPAQAGRADEPGEVRRVHHAGRPRAVPGAAQGHPVIRRARLAVHRGGPRALLGEPRRDCPDRQPCECSGPPRCR